MNECWIITLSAGMLRFVTKDAIVKEYKLWDRDKAFDLMKIGSIFEQGKGARNLLVYYCL